MEDPFYNLTDVITGRPSVAGAQALSLSSKDRTRLPNMRGLTSIRRRN